MKKTNKCYEVNEIKPADICQIFTMALVNSMKSKRFKYKLANNKFVCLMPDKSIMLTKSIDFYDGFISVIKTQDLLKAIEKGLIGKLIQQTMEKNCEYS